MTPTIKVALVVPPRTTLGFIAPIDPPMGIAWIAGYLESKGINVIIIDSIVENLSVNDIIHILIEKNIKIIGITCNYCTYHQNALFLSHKIKKEIKDSVVFIGGNHASSLSDSFLVESGGDIDCVVRGEGEITTHEFVMSVVNKTDWKNVKGISYTGFNTPNRELINDLDSMPLPAYHLLSMELYERYNIISSRGCPFGCDFCASTVLFSKKVRYRSPKNVLCEIYHLLENYGEKRVWFSDDTFTVNNHHTNKFLDEVIDSNKPFKWSCLTSVSHVNRKILERMKQAGCQYISYGVESGNVEILKKFIHKPIDVNAIIETSNLTHEVGIGHYGFFIFGFPGENTQTVNDTYELIKKCKFKNGGINILVPLPGTKLWQILFTQQKRFTINEINWNEFFARGQNDEYSIQAAELASRWCSLTPKELIRACEDGKKLFNSL